MKWASRRRHLAAALATVVALALTGCNGGDGSPPQAGPSASLAEPGEAPTLEAEPVTTSGRLVGRLPRKERHRAERTVARVAVRWLDAAYGGTYPRRGFRASFPGFTPGARRAAVRDLGLMTNKPLARRITGVAPTAIRVRTDLFAVNKRPVSGTAHVLLKFRTEGKVERRYRVAGRLMMTRHGRGWQVFAYDVSKSAVAPGGRAGAGRGKDRDDARQERTRAKRKHHRQKQQDQKQKQRRKKRKQKGGRG